MNPAKAFEPDDLMWDLMGDIRMLLVFPGALIMQVMHPSIGAAVGEFSVYRTDPWGRAFRSLSSVMLWVYGGEDSFAEGERLRKMHRSIRGIDEHGTRYRSLDPKLYGWVHATAYERMIRQAGLFGKPFSDSQQDRLYDEFLRLGNVLGIAHHDMPPNRREYWEYFDCMVESELEATPTALDVIHRMSHELQAPPKWPRRMETTWRPFGAAFGRTTAFITLGTLPPRIRKKLGVEWTPGRERAFRQIAFAVRNITPMFPERIRFMPYAYSRRRSFNTQTTQIGHVEQ